MFGIDVSEHNGNIQWEQVKPQIGFAILRLGWMGRSGSHMLDAKFQRNYAECKRLGIPIGVYIYCYSSAPAAAADGAEWTLRNLSGKTLELPVFIDMEEQKIASQGRQTLTQICIAFCERIRQGGFTPGVYANQNWFNNYLDKDELKRRYFTWIAAYRSGTDHFKGEFDMWQNSESGRVGGISGPVDTNYLYVGFTGGSDAPAPPQPGPAGGGESDPYADGPVIPQPEPAGGEESDPYADGPVVPRPAPAPEQRIYVVRPGDTLSGIALRFHTTVQALAEKNSIKNPDRIDVGQRLIV